MSVLVGKKAPGFSAKAVVDNKIVENFSLQQYLGQKYVVLFFYPKDFTFVCPTELHAFQEYLPQFEALDAVVVGCSTDTEFSHLAWATTPKEKGGIEGVSYPLVADTNKTIASDYDVLAGEYIAGEGDTLEVEGELIAYRGLFLIDKSGTVQHQVVNNMPLGRNVEEALRMVEALQHVETHGEVCPVGWRRGRPAMKANAESTANYLMSN